MKEETKLKIILIASILLLFVVNYPLIDKALEEFLSGYEVGVVERVIDGDTVIINNESVRLLGINSPEKKEPYYIEAKEYLEILTLNTTVKLKRAKEDKDKYNRKLRYLFIGFTNINLEMIKQGLANFYFPSGKDSYYKDFKKAWEECVKEDENLCEKSKDKCSSCIELKEFNYKDQEVVLYNRCGFDCELTNWEIKDEGRKKFTFPDFVLDKGKQVEIKIGEGKNTKDILFWQGEDYVWTESGDTLFLRDSKGKLVLWRSY